MSKEIALFCLAYPKTAEKRRRVVSLLESNVPYYRSPKAKCTTWSYFTPTSKKGGPTQIADALGPDGKDLLIGGMEIYTDKSGISMQLDEPWFKNYHATVKAEDLYSKDEDLVVWYHTAGFLSRESTAPPFGKGVVVLVGVITCKDGMREKAVETWGEYADWVQRNEPDTLTYSLMTRPKAPNEILVFERFKDHDTFIAHTKPKEIKESFDKVKPYIQSRPIYANEFDEVDSSFVGHVVGGDSGEGNNASSKL